jgi:hypothetical protein
MTTSPNDTVSASAVVTRRSAGRYLLFLGLALTILGMMGYVTQIAMKRLFTPWYMPAMATLGVVLVMLALWNARTVWRMLALLLVVLVAGAEWAFLLAMGVPEYTGPVAAGQPFPTFMSARADGKLFTERDLQGDQNNVLVFFRGRW